MKTDTQKRRDPVCKMWVTDDLFQKDYADMHFVFCSEQCLERFTANPHLYIGYPGEQAPVQQGEASMKRRRFRLTEIESAEHIVECLLAMMGVEEVIIVGGKLQIHYDVFQATARQVQNVIEGAGGKLSQSLIARVHYAVINMFETLELDSRELPPQHPGHHH